MSRRRRRQPWTAFEPVSLEELPPRARLLKPATISDLWLNSRYLVMVSYRASSWGALMHLMVQRTDRQPVRDWYDFQRIKNEIAGEDRIAIEVYPAESELTDDAHMYHLWVLPEGKELPFTLK